MIIGDAALHAATPTHHTALQPATMFSSTLIWSYVPLSFMFREPGNLGLVTLYSVLALLSKETGVMVLPILAAWTWSRRPPAKQTLPLLGKYALVVSH